MFQVATHPSSFDYHYRPAKMPSLQLPRVLARPKKFIEVPVENIPPEAAHIPPQYIRSGAPAEAPKLRAGIAALSASQIPSSVSRSHLPSSITIPLSYPPTSHVVYPTHMIALTSSKSGSHVADVRLLPVHSLVLASHCPLVPRLPHSKQSLRSNSITLPVVVLALPSPGAYPVLHNYMYDHRLDLVFKNLFPVPTGFLQSLSHQPVAESLKSRNTVHQLASYLCSSASSNLQVVMTHAGHVKEVWQNMVALGLLDSELWDAIDLAWEVVLGALNLAASNMG